MLQFVNLLIDQYYIGQNVRVAFVQYSDRANVIFNLNQYNDANSIKAAVLRVQQIAGASNPSAALNVISSQVLRPLARQGYWRQVVLVTDQLQQRSELSGAINNLRTDSLFRLHGVGIAVSGRPLDTNALSPYRVTTVNGYRALANSVQTHLQYICPPDIIPTPSPAPGEFRIIKCCLPRLVYRPYCSRLLQLESQTASMPPGSDAFFRSRPLVLVGV